MELRHGDPLGRSHLSYVIIITPTSRRISSKELQPAAMLSNLADLANHAYRSLVLGVVLGAVKCTLLKRCAAVDGRVARRADLEFGELVKLDLYGVMRIPLALSFGLLSL